MSLPLEFLIAFRYLRSKRREGFISVTAIFSFVGIMIGVATLIIVMSVMNGFRHELVDRILGVNAHITLYSHNQQIDNYRQIISKIKDVEGIKFINPIVESQAMVSTRVKNSGALIKGIKFSDLKNKSLISQNITRGDLKKIKRKNSVIVGSVLAQNSNLKIGDKIKIISAETNNTIIGAVPRVKTYRVSGVFDSGLYEYDSSSIFMNFEMAQIHFRFKGAASAIEIFVEDEAQLEDVKRKIYPILINFKGLYARDWQQANASFIDALKVESTVMFLILTLIILVAAFNIISSMIMLVNDKNKNIALLRTLGMSRAKVMRIFLICGSIIGVAGTLFGFVIGVAFSKNINSIKLWLESMTDTTLFNPTIYFLSTLPSQVLVSDVVMIVGMSLVISFLATIYPAYKASKSNPADILRYE